MSFMNGLSALGSGVAQYAATAGLEAQKSQLAAQNLTLADQLATTRETGLQASAGVIAATAADKAQAATAANLATTEAGATARSSATNTTSLGVANIGAQSAADVEAGRAGSAEKINKSSIDAAAINLTKQLAVTGSDITVDANSGNAVSIDKATNKVTPIIGPDGSPLRMPNPEASKAITAAMNTTNEEMRNLNTQRSQDVGAARDELDRTSQRSDLFGPEKDTAIALATKKLAAVQAQYEAPLAALRARQAANGASLMSLAHPGATAAPAATDRPALSTFGGGAKPPAAAPGLMNNGASP